MQEEFPEWCFKALALIEAKYDRIGRVVTDGIEDLYLRTLAPMDSAIGMDSVMELLLETDEPPDVSHIARRHAEKLTGIPSPSDAWNEVQSNLGKVKHKPFSHRAIAAAVQDIGGLDMLWHSYRWAESKVTLSNIREQFLKAYKYRQLTHLNEVVRIVTALGVPAGRERFPALIPPVPLSPFGLIEPAEELPEDGSGIKVRGEDRFETPSITTCKMPAEVRERLKGIGFLTGSKKV